jgi:hypothetical protein
MNPKTDEKLMEPPATGDHRARPDLRLIRSERWAKSNLRLIQGEQPEHGPNWRMMPARQRLGSQASSLSPNDDDTIPVPTLPDGSPA